MADQAAYILMGAYIGLFAVLFICVFGAIIAMGREQTSGERPAVTPVDRPVRPPAVTADTPTRSAPKRTGARPTRANPAS